MEPDDKIPSASTPTPTPLAEDKVRKEIEKLQAETDAIRRPIYKTVTFYTAISPVALAVLAFLYSQRSGWFDVQRKSLDTQKERLMIDTQKLDDKKKEQEAHIARYESELERLRGQTLTLDHEILTL